jgi:hypothetical protein
VFVDGNAQPRGVLSLAPSAIGASLPDVVVTLRLLAFYLKLVKFLTDGVFLGFVTSL